MSWKLKIGIIAILVAALAVMLWPRRDAPKTARPEEERSTAESTARKAETGEKPTPGPATKPEPGAVEERPEETATTAARPQGLSQTTTRTTSPPTLQRSKSS